MALLHEWFSEVLKRNDILAHQCEGLIQRDDFVLAMSAVVVHTVRAQDPSVCFAVKRKYTVVASAPMHLLGICYDFDLLQRFGDLRGELLEGAVEGCEIGGVGERGFEDGAHGAGKAGLYILNG